MAAARDPLESANSAFHSRAGAFMEELFSRNGSGRRRILNAVGNQSAVMWRAGREAASLLAGYGSLESAQEYVHSEAFRTRAIPSFSPVNETTWSEIKKDMRVLDNGTLNVLHNVLRGARGELVVGLLALAARGSSPSRVRTLTAAATSLSRVDRELALEAPRSRGHVSQEVDQLTEMLSTYPEIVDVVAKPEILEALRRDARSYAPMLDALVRPLSVALAGPTTNAAAQRTLRTVFDKIISAGGYAPPFRPAEVFNAAELIAAQPGSGSVIDALRDASPFGGSLADERHWQGRGAGARPVNELHVRGTMIALASDFEFSKAFCNALASALVAGVDSVRFRDDIVAVQTAAASQFGSFSGAVQLACNFYEETTLRAFPDITLEWSDLEIEGFSNGSLAS
jgi:hypothetical protein